MQLRVIINLVVWYNGIGIIKYDKKEKDQSFLEHHSKNIYDNNSIRVLVRVRSKHVNMNKY